MKFQELLRFPRLWGTKNGYNERAASRSDRPESTEPQPEPNNNELASTNDELVSNNNTSDLNIEQPESSISVPGLSDGEPESSNDTKNLLSPSPQLPDWFLVHCVQSPIDLETLNIPLQIRPLEPRDISEQSNTESQSSEIFQIEAVVYQAMRTVLSEVDSEDSATHFRNDAMFLHIPGEVGYGAPAFIDSVVATFAREIGANLLTLPLDDLETLTDNLRMDKSEIVSNFIADSTVGRYFGADNESSTDDSDNREGPREKAEKKDSLFQTLFRSVASKSADATSTDDSRINVPIILHICEAHQYYDLGYFTLNKILSDVQSSASRPGNRILVIASSHRLEVSTGVRVFSRAGTKPMKTGVPLIPVKSQNQLRFLEDGLSSSAFYKQKNIKALHKSSERLHGRDLSSKLLRLYSQCQLSVDSKVDVSFSKEVLEPRQIDYIARLIPQNAGISDLERIVSEATRREDLLSSFGQSEEVDNRWSSFPENIRKAIHNIERSEEKYDREKMLLGHLVDPKLIDETLDDIELDSDTKSNIIQLVEHLSTPDHERHGILEKARINGALLYGPPGTGKTLLARVLAKECQAAMISVTSADISDEYVGETEKTIKSLFSLGRLLFPSVLFFDEADSLFHARTSGDRTWERDQVNQLLAEMDGLVKFKTAPFVLLATNFPRHLDHAVLRRTPSRFHIGLPSFQARQRIFETYLRDDKLDSSVTLGDLAFNTNGYSGSDIRSVCTKAALNREADDLAPRRDGCKLLTQAHLYTSLKTQISSTVSRAALSHIREFAREHDPSAWAAIQASDEDSSMKADFNRYISDDSQPTETPQSFQKSSESSPRAARLTDSPPVPTQDLLQPSDVVAKVVPKEGESSREAPPEQTSYNTGFRYPKLNQSGKQIRVLGFEASLDAPHSQPGVIRCNLETVDLGDYTPTYKSLMNLDPEEDADKFGAWYIETHARQNPSNDKQRVWNDVILPFRVGWDVPMEQMKALEPRFCWGDYVALSYCWGDHDIREDIYVNGRTFSVTRNLFLALKRLRNSYEVRKKHLRVWVDAICINQNDLAERAIEVKRMQLVFSEAIAVRGWVGMWPENTAASYDTVRNWLDRAPDLDVEKVPASPAQNEEVFRAMISLAESMFREDYWQRLWVAQEIFLAPSMVFWYGNGYFTANDLVKLLLIFLQEGFGLPFGNTTAVKFNANSFREKMRVACERLVLLRVRGDAIHRRELDVDEIISLAQVSTATDQRDKVFGILALLPDTVSSLIHPSYEPDILVDGVYASLTRACIVGEGNLDAWARIRMRPSFGRDLPSWVFDLSCPRSTRMSTRDSRHDANSGAGHISPKFSEDGLNLLCDGVVVDVIETIGAMTDMAISHSVPIETTSEPMDPENDPATTQLPPYLLPVDENSKLALARVLCQDSNYEYSQKPSLLDVPWISKEEFHWAEHSGIYPPPPTGLLQDFHQDGIGQSWLMIVFTTGLRQVFNEFLHANAAYSIHGVPLRNYFTCRDVICPDPPAYIRLAQESFNVSDDRRLCTTQGQLLGMAPKYAKRGDKIAVLYNCDMPVVLRPRPGGQCYEYIGSCFIEGLMKGEAIQGVLKGQYNPVIISIS
ncbi:hypothetical protein F5Y10DRAFT_284608 [Nemania abortiva]|nr:hypothetical protein F5Y10DRAFT_284608 [Nemania abortiva]